MKDKVDNKPKPQWFKLLNFADQPAVWIWAEGDSGLGLIWTANRNIKLPEVGGVAVGDNTGLGAGVIWIKGGLVYGVAGTLKQKAILDIANHLG